MAQTETAPRIPTQDELVEQIRRTKPDDMLGFEWQEYGNYLDYEHAQEFIGGKSREEWGEVNVIDPQKMLEHMRDYMDFAINKANNERGISANRSIGHYIAWTWLRGDREFSEQIRTEYLSDYHSYGKPILRMICDRYGFDGSAID